MLYDPKWEQQTKADPFSLASLIAWLEKQSADNIYAYTCNGHCLLAQYFGASGFKNVFMYPRCFVHGDGQPDDTMSETDAQRLGITTPLPEHFNRITIAHPRTFGAALERARAAVR